MTSKCESNRFSISEDTHKKAFYSRFQAMKERCRRKSRQDYKYYGGKGIKVEWASFMEFKRDMWESFKEHAEKHGVKETTLDRIDIENNYCFSNCRWATRKTQSFNSSRVRKLEHNGKKYSLAELARKNNLTHSTLRRRIDWYGMSIDEAIKLPVKLGAHQYDKDA